MGVVGEDPLAMIPTEHQLVLADHLILEINATNAARRDITPMIVERVALVAEGADLGKKCLSNKIKTLCSCLVGCFSM